MKILYQPIKGNPGDWEACDFDQWVALGEFDVNAVNIQGVVFEGPDHYGIRRLPNGDLIAAGWHTDLADWPLGMRWAREIQFRPLGPSSDPRLGGAVSTHQTTKIYAEMLIKPVLDAAYADSPNVTVHPWSNFNEAPYASKPGRWMNNAQFAAHQKSRAKRPWREWTDGLDPAELDHKGHVKDQRGQGRYVIPKGTRTYYHNPGAGTGVASADVTNVLGLTPTGATNQQSGNVGTNGAVAFEAVSPGGEPASAAWPTTGEYRYQIDVLTTGADLVFGLMSLGNATGGFERVDAAVNTQLQRIEQDQAAFSGSGLRVASITDPAWSAGNASDRVGVVMAGQRVLGHGNQTFTLQLGELDDFIDGPWPSAVAGSGQDAILLGLNF